MLARNLRYMPNVATLKLDVALCVGCGQCAEVCPHGVFSLDGATAVISDKDACMECGACALNCPVEAISVSPGVGCAQAIIKGWIRGGPPDCGCGEGDCC